MRWRLAAVAATLALAAGAGTAYVVARDARDAPRHSGTAAVAGQASVRRAAVTPLSSDAPRPSRAGVGRQLRRAALAPEFGGALAALVVDAQSGAVLFARHPGAAVPPASTTKLLTAVAALEGLGPDARLTTSVRRRGRTLYLVGGGDVTLAAAHRAIYPAPATLAQLAARTASAVAGRSFRVRYDDSAWTGPEQAAGWTSSYVTGGNIAPPAALEVDEGRLSGFTSLHPQPRTGDPAHAAAEAFAAALRAAGIRTRGAVRPAAAPATGDIASVSSPPVAALVARMLTDSDNDLAESLARAVALKAGEPASFSGAARAVTAGVAALGLPTHGLRLFDGSGLSRLDRVTPRLLVGLLRLVAERPELRPIAAGLPVAGFTGTLTDRYRHRPERVGAGVVRAKTGTLAGVNALAGTVVDADGRLLVFAFLTNRAADPDTTERALDRVAARLARCGCS